MGKVLTGNTPPTSDKSNWSDEINGHVWITPTDINSLTMAKSERHLSDIGWSIARSVPAFSVLITSIASIGKNAVNTVPAAFNQQINAIVPEGNDAYFILCAMEKETPRFAGMAGQTATAIINKTEFGKFSLSVPTIQEQEQISSFFFSLDNLITLHQSEYNKIVNIKKALLGKMFPKEGADRPEIRFAGFTDAWEQRKVKDIFKVTRGNVLAAPETNTTKTPLKPYPVYSSQTKDNGLMGYYGDYLFDTAITWTTDGANAGTVRHREGKFYCTNVCGVLLSDGGYANQMVAEALNLIAWRHVSYVGNPKLMNNVMSEIAITLSSDLNEQLRISGLIKSLDNLITLHQREHCDKKLIH